MRDPRVLGHGVAASTNWVSLVVEDAADNVDGGAAGALSPDTDGVLGLVAGGVDVGPCRDRRRSEEGEVDRVEDDVDEAIRIVDHEALIALWHGTASIASSRTPGVKGPGRRRVARSGVRHSNDAVVVVVVLCIVVTRHASDGKGCFSTRQVEGLETELRSAIGSGHVVGDVACRAVHGACINECLVVIMSIDAEVRVWAACSSCTLSGGAVKRGVTIALREARAVRRERLLEGSVGV